MPERHTAATGGIHPTAVDVSIIEGIRGELATLGFATRPEDRWLPDELAMVRRAIGDLQGIARWSPAACTRALGGPLVLIRDRSGPITTDAAGVRYPVLGTYDAGERLLTVNDWSFDPRVGGALGGRRVLVHELAHAWDRRTWHLLSLGIGRLPGPRASAYAGVSSFEDWADAVMASVYGADGGFETFDRTAAGHPSPRLRYVRWAFARFR